MFQKDYWGMSDERLMEEGKKNNLPAERYEKFTGTDVSYPVYDHNYIIAFLVGRDAALRTRWITAMSIISILISIAALAVSLFRK